MTPAIDQVEKIVIKLSQVLPPLLSAAGLDDFEDYSIYPPDDADKKILAVYVDAERDFTVEYEIRFVIQAQLARERRTTEYHSVIFDAIRKNITSTLMGLEKRDNVEADIWPLDRGNGTSFCFYELSFTQDMDDCDD